MTIHLPEPPLPLARAADGTVEAPVLPASLSRALALPREPSARIAIAYKGSAFFEEREVVETEPPPVLVGSWVAFAKNGRAQGNAFTDIPAGTYYPSVSLYNGATVRVNFGATPFAHPPGGRAVAERFSDKAAEDTLLDLTHELLYGDGVTVTPAPPAVAAESDHPSGSEDD
jgi:hypothetical protein